MIKETLSSVIHIEVYAIIGFVIFFTFFIATTIHAFRMKKEEVNHLSAMPLDDSEIQINQTSAN